MRLFCLFLSFIAVSSFGIGCEGYVYEPDDISYDLVDLWEERNYDGCAIRRIDNTEETQRFYIDSTPPLDTVLSYDETVSYILQIINELRFKYPESPDRKYLFSIFDIQNDSIIIKQAINYFNDSLPVEYSYSNSISIENTGSIFINSINFAISSRNTRFSEYNSRWYYQTLDSTKTYNFRNYIEHFSLDTPYLTLLDIERNEPIPSDREKALYLGEQLARAIGYLQKLIKQRN